MTGQTRSQVSLLLQALPSVVRDEILAESEQLSLQVGDILIEAGEPITHTYLPLSGAVSLVTLLEDGSMVEAAAVGNEGMVGLPVVLGATATPNVRAVCQIASESLRLPAEALTRLSEKHQPLRSTLLRYANSVLVEAAQSAVCNRRHPAEKRAAKWLLLSHDRVEGDEFFLTQEFLASMLGVRRASVTEVAGVLREKGLITYKRGAVTIVDRQGLEHLVCSCYEQIRTEYDSYLADAAAASDDANIAVR